MHVDPVLFGVVLSCGKLGVLLPLRRRHALFTRPFHLIRTSHHTGLRWSSHALRRRHTRRRMHHWCCGWLVPEWLGGVQALVVERWQHDGRRLLWVERGGLRTGGDGCGGVGGVVGVLEGWLRERGGCGWERCESCRNGSRPDTWSNGVRILPV